MNPTPSIINGWPVAGPAPERADALAAAELADVRRILAIDMTDRAYSPAHEWVLRDSSPVRVEIYHGTSQDDALRALCRLAMSLPPLWCLFVDERGAEWLAKDCQIRGLADAGPVPELVADTLRILSGPFPKRDVAAWPAAPGRQPDRADVLAAADLADVRRILVIDVTAATFLPSHEWALRNSAPVRVEIHHGTSLASVLAALCRVIEMLSLHWEFLTEELHAAVLAKEYQRVDLRNGTIDGVPVAQWDVPAVARADGRQAPAADSPGAE